jgi:pimeloyl-ACP methyl ester carboxylesterase
MGKWIAGGIAAAIVAVLGITFYIYDEPDIPRAVLEAKYAAPPSKFVVLSDGTRVHYRERGMGNAPVLLLLHGSNSSLYDWEPWSKISSDSFWVISIDLPGHGLTGAVGGGDYSEKGMADFVGAFTDQIGLRRFALAGNSMGGGVAARFAEMYPERVTHLILVDAYAWGMSATGDRIPFAFKLARVPVLGNLLLHVTPRSLVEEGLEDAVVRRKILTDTMIDQYWDFARMEDTRQATLARFRLPQDTYVRDHISRIKAPTLILWGSDDRLLPVAGARAWAKAIPGSKLIVYPRAGHLPMEEVPQKSADDVRAFVTRIP